MGIRYSYQSVIRNIGHIFRGAAALLLIFSAGSASRADEDKPVEQIKGDARIEVLRFLAAHNEANYRKIETWRGKYHFVDRFPQRIQLADKKVPVRQQMRDVITILEGTAEFALDMDSDKLWSECKEDGAKTKFLSLDGKEAITPRVHRPVDMKVIAEADRVTKLSNIKYGPLPEHPEDPHHVRKTSARLARRDAYRPLERLRDLGDRLDPRRFYSTGTSLEWEELRLHVKALTGGDGEEVRARVDRVTEVEKIGSPGTMEYKITMRYFTGGPKDEEGLAWDVTRFAEIAQYLPIEHTLFTRTGKIHEHRSWIYQSLDGVLIPKEFHLTINEARKGELELDRHLKFVEGFLNEPLPEDTFSTDHLGLTKGERLEDKIENRLYVSDGTSLLPASDSAVRKQVRHSRRWILACINGFLFIALVAFLLRRHIRWPKKKEGA